MKTMKRFLYLFAGFLAAAVCVACDHAAEDLPAPVIKFQADEIRADLNNVDVPSVICVVESAAGLSRVEAYTVSVDENGNETMSIIGEPVVQFPNDVAYSLKLDPLYTENMTAVRVVAADKAGKETVGEIRLIVTGVWSADIEFVDENGDPIDGEISFVEGETEDVPQIFVKAVSDVPVYKIEVYELIGGKGTLVVSQDFDGTSTEETVAVMRDGAKYVPAKEVTGLRAVLTVGPATDNTKTDTDIVDVKVGPALTIVINEPEESFNGVETGSTVTVTGIATAVKDNISSFECTVISRDGSEAEPYDVELGADGSFTITAEAVETLAGMRIYGTTDDGRDQTADIDIHVGYRYYVFEAQASTNQYTLAENRIFFDSVNGKIYDYVTAFANQSTVDVAFGGFSSTDPDGYFRSVRCERVKANSLSSTSASGTAGYRPKTDWTDPYDAPIAVWAEFDTQSDDADRLAKFEEATVSEFSRDFTPIDYSTSGGKNDAKNYSTAAQTIAVLKASSSVEPENIMVFENTAGKNVLVTFDAMQTEDETAGICNSSIFTFKAKVEL